jgi:hypothetical protein
MDVPVPTGVPPQLPAYHLQLLPDPPVAVNVLLAPEQIASGLADADIGATGVAFTVTVTLAQAELPQPFSHLA